MKQILKNILIGKQVILNSQLFGESNPNVIPIGTKGVIEYIDDANQIHVNWENGSILALIPEVDNFSVL